MFELKHKKTINIQTLAALTCGAFFVICLAPLAYSGEEGALPPALQQTLAKALKTEDAFIIDATFAAASKAYPEEQALIALYRKRGVSAANIPFALMAETQPPRLTPVARQTAPRNPLVLKGTPHEAGANGATSAVKWSGEIAAAFNKASGNTDTESITSNIDLEREKQYWRHKFAGQIRFANQDGERVNEDYRLRLGSDWKFAPRLFLFGEAEYVADEFSGFDYRLTESLGLGSRWKWRGNDRYLDLRASVGARHFKSTEANAVVEHNAIFRPEADFNWQVHDGLSFKQTLRSTIGTDVTTTEAETSLKYKLNSRLDLKLALQLEHTSTVPVGTKKLETYTTTGLTYHLFD